jgi:hypothetical protein
MSKENENQKPETDPEFLKESLDDLGEKDPDSEYDLTKEDKQALGPKDLSLDGGEDEELLLRSQRVDFTGEDLDVPGAELDDEDEAIGNEDEENNLYSLGGDNNDD